MFLINFFIEKCRANLQNLSWHEAGTITLKNMSFEDLVALRSAVDIFNHQISEEMNNKAKG